MNRVLDLDLDFFLADCCPLAAPGERPPLEGHSPWEPERVRRFLTEQCGLSSEDPIPGRIFQTHDQALSFWQERMCDGSLAAPFSVTHVDAHSDLGIGMPGPTVVLDGVLPLLPENRPVLSRYYERRQLDEANYLLYALAFRWIGELTNVRILKSRPDFPAVLWDPDQPNAIRLRSFAASLLESRNGREPSVPYRCYPNYAAYRAEDPFDFVTLAISPRYAPAEADRLLPVFEEFIAR